MHQPAKIIVRTPNWIGDHIMARSFYQGLRGHYPGAEITFLCPPALLGIKDESFCNFKIPVSDLERRTFSGLMSLSKKLRSECFDLAITLPATFSAALLFWLTGIPNRVGFSGDGSQLFLTSYRAWKGVRAHRHKTDLYLELLEFIQGKPYTPYFKTISNPKSEKQIVVAPGASISLREWPYFIDFLRQISTVLSDYKIYVVGSPKESGWSKRVQDLKLERVHDLIGKTSLTELEDLCRKSALVVANDSGIAHVAGTLAGVSTLVLFGPGDPVYVTPRGPSVSVMRLPDLPCSPCEKPYCRAPFGYKACLNQLSLRSVVSKTLSILGFDSKTTTLVDFPI